MGSPAQVGMGAGDRLDQRGGIKGLIPERILAIIRAFLNAKKTGKMVLNIKDGQIMVIDTQESVRL
jgi:hypothetical protein